MSVSELNMNAPISTDDVNNPLFAKLIFDLFKNIIGEWISKPRNEEEQHHLVFGIQMHLNDLMSKIVPKWIQAAKSQTPQKPTRAQFVKQELMPIFREAFNELAKQYAEMDLGRIDVDEASIDRDAYVNSVLDDYKNKKITREQMLMKMREAKSSDNWLKRAMIEENKL